MNQQEKLCILCLHILEDGEPYSELNKTNILEDLKLVNPNFVEDFILTEESLVCHNCTNELNTFARFKEQIISNEIKLESNSSNNLDEFLLTLSEDTSLLCRTCFTTPSNDEAIERTWIDFEYVFSQCHIELNKQILQPSRLCNSCYCKLEAMKDFITLCLENEERIKEIKAEHENLTTVQLVSIIKGVILKVKSQKIEEEPSLEESQVTELLEEPEVAELHVNTMGTPKMYKKRKSNTSESPSTSQSEKFLDILTKIQEQLPQMHDSIDATPSENQDDVTLNMNELGLFLDSPTTEYNLTQELIGVLEGRLKEDVTVDDATKELIDVLEGRINESAVPQEDAVPTSPEVIEKRQLRSKNSDNLKETSSETNEVRRQPKRITKKRGRPRKEKSEPPVKKAKTVNDDVESGSDDNLKEIEKKLTNRPVQVTVIKSKKRTNKAQLDKTWQELTSAPTPQKVSPPAQPKTEPGKEQGVEIIAVKKKGKQSANVKPKKEVVWMHCSKCPFKTYAQNSFIQHQLIHAVMSELPTLYCEHCRFNTTSQELMTQHTNTHETANLSYKCVFCDDFFKKKTSCMYHTLRHDDQDVASQFYCLVYNGAADEEYFECYQCDYQNTEESPMPDHVIDHTIEIPKNPMLAKFKCELCPFLTKTEEVLERHMKLQHTGKNKGKKKLKAEPLTNEELPLLKCDKCHYMTRQPRSLVNHIGLKHNRTIPPLVAGEALAAKAANEGKTLYYCNECSYSTYRKLNMPRHMLVHRTKENMIMYECPHCIFETKHRRSYTRHMEAKHGVVV